MAVPGGIYSRAIELLLSRPFLGTERDRRALLVRSGIGAQLIGQIDFSGATFTFLAKTIETLAEYGELGVGQDALTAFFAACSELVGPDDQVRLAELTREWLAVREAGRMARCGDVRGYLTCLFHHFRENMITLAPEKCWPALYAHHPA